MIVNILAAAVSGVQGKLIDVEVDISPGLPAFHIVGLGDATVQEARDRIRAAIKNSSLDFPLQRITVNLAPANLPKEGPAFDFPIAMGIIAASSQSPPLLLQNTLIIGELSMTGKLRGVASVLPIILAAKRSGLRCVMLPEENAEEALLAGGMEIIPLRSLEELMEYILTGTPLPHADNQNKPKSIFAGNYQDIADIIGQSSAKRALEVSAAGGHNLLFIGPPGCGKTMLATRLPGILPPLTEEEALEVACVKSAAGELLGNNTFSNTPPFRAPHHTTSTAGLIGGGYPPRPGEVTLAHHGILFLDETPEFHRDALEALRQPLEAQKILVSRSRYNVVFPASFTLLGAMNPCPCGYFGDPFRECRCSKYERGKYIGKLSGPLLDRIDLHVEVPNVLLKDKKHFKETEDSKTIRMRVLKARNIQTERFKASHRDIQFSQEFPKGVTTFQSQRHFNTHRGLRPPGGPCFQQALGDLRDPRSRRDSSNPKGIHDLRHDTTLKETVPTSIYSLCNAKMPVDLWLKKEPLTTAASVFLQKAFEKLSLSNRTYHRILTVARTIADLDESEQISEDHLAEALYYRSLDRKYWQH